MNEGEIEVQSGNTGARQREKTVRKRQREKEIRYDYNFALYHFLSRTTAIPPDCNSLRLFCDGCGGQNKNSYILFVLIFWLYHAAPDHLDNVLLVFPVRGHSFLPADRVFRRIEKISKKKTEILTREEYWEIFGEVGQTNVLGVNWTLFDFKELENSLKKIKGIREAKRIYIEKNRNKAITIRYENYYRNDVSQPQALLKKGKSLAKLSLKSIELGRVVKPRKLKDTY